MISVNLPLPNNRNAILILPDDKLTKEEYEYICEWFAHLQSGVIVAAQPPRAPDGAYECPKCGTPLEKGGTCGQHGLPAQPRQ